jgi:hypothetical protein
MHRLECPREAHVMRQIVDSYWEQPTNPHRTTDRVEASQSWINGYLSRPATKLCLSIEYVRMSNLGVQTASKSQMPHLYPKAPTFVVIVCLHRDHRTCSLVNTSNPYSVDT